MSKFIITPETTLEELLQLENIPLEDIEVDTRCIQQITAAGFFFEEGILTVIKNIFNKIRNRINIGVTVDKSQATLEDENYHLSSIYDKSANEDV